MYVYSTNVNHSVTRDKEVLPGSGTREERESEEVEGSTTEVSLWGVHLPGPEETNPFHLFIVWPVGAPTGFTRSYVPMDCIRKNSPGWATGKM